MEQDIYKQANSAEFVFYILSGVAALSNANSAAKRQVLSFELPDSVIGLSATGAYISNATAMDDVDLLKCPAIIFNSQLVQSPKLAFALTNHLVKQQEYLAYRMFTNGQCSALEGVARFILEMACSQSDEIKHGHQIKLPMNRYYIADYLGLTIETVSRSFSALKRKGLIQFTNSKGLKVSNPQGLEQLADF